MVLGRRPCGQLGGICAVFERIFTRGLLRKISTNTAVKYEFRTLEQEDTQRSLYTAEDCAEPPISTMWDEMMLLDLNYEDDAKFYEQMICPPQYPQMEPEEEAIKKQEENQIHQEQTGETGYTTRAIEIPEYLDYLEEEIVGLSALPKKLTRLSFPCSSSSEKARLNFLFSYLMPSDYTQTTISKIDWRHFASQLLEHDSQAWFQLAGIVEFITLKRANPNMAERLLVWVASFIPNKLSLKESPLGLFSTLFPFPIMLNMVKAHLAAFEFHGICEGHLRKRISGQVAASHLQSAWRWFMLIPAVETNYRSQVDLVSAWITFRVQTLRLGHSPSSTLPELFLREDPIFARFYPMGGTNGSDYSSQLPPISSRISGTPVSPVSPSCQQDSILLKATTTFSSEQAIKKNYFLTGYSGPSLEKTENRHVDIMRHTLTFKNEDPPLSAFYIQLGLQALYEDISKYSSDEMNALQRMLERDCAFAANERRIKELRRALELGVPGIVCKAPHSMTDLVTQWNSSLTTRLVSSASNLSSNLTSMCLHFSSSVVDAQPILESILVHIGAERIASMTISTLLEMHSKSAYWIPELGAFLFGKLSLEVGSRLLTARGDEDLMSSWPAAIKISVGGRLLSEALSCALMEDDTPAFHHTIRRFRKDLQLGLIIPCPELIERFGSMLDLGFCQNSNSNTEAEKATSVFGSLDLSLGLPMVVTPRPWSTWKSGGYLTRHIPCFRVREDMLQVAQVMIADRQGELITLLNGLSFLGRTPWRINTRVLAVISATWLARKDQTSGILGKKAPVLLGTDSVERKADQHSIECDLTYKLLIADAFQKCDQFFLPHNVDFRGRAYPIPPLLAHIGPDICRGVMLFGGPQGIAPLGERGLYWLMIHLANMCGVNKLSFEDRIEWIKLQRHNIMRSALDPINTSWWMEMESPWQVLAACFELASAWEHPQGPEAWVSSLPIQQDGSCNGLQHYAALGRDALGAEVVNLQPGAKPADIYSAIAEEVNAKIKAEALEYGDQPFNMDQIDHQVSNGMIAKWILSESRIPLPINRKIVKQSVMTSVYGVTLFGATEQVFKRLTEVCPKQEEIDGIGDERGGRVRALRAAARYIASLILGSLGGMFNRSRSIQAWLNSLVTLVTSSAPQEWAQSQGFKIEQEKRTAKELLRNLAKPGQIRTILKTRAENTEHPPPLYPRTPMGWRSPIGFPIVQPYRERVKIEVPTPLQKVSIQVYPDEPTPICPRQQSAAFAPNYIHSLDASHMFMTAHRAENMGLLFAAVHDSFWTLPKDVDLLHAELRKAFVELHSRPLLTELLAELQSRFADHVVPLGVKSGNKIFWTPLVLPSPPELGTFDLNLVLNSPYFFN